VAVVAGGASGSVLLVLVAAAGTVVALRRSLRRRRLGEGTPDERISGAWAEFTDALRLAGRPVPAHLAATEAAAFAAEPPHAPPRADRRGIGRLRRATPPAPSGSARPGPSSGPSLAGPSPSRPPEPSPGDQRQPGQAPADQAPPEPATETPLPPLDALVAGINTVGFAPGSAEPGQAASAGRQVVAYADALRARRSWWRRLWWTVHPGPLRWRRDS
jgi:hypothetical protein